MTEPRDSSTSGPNIPKEKQTSLGLYLTAREAYDRWRLDPEKSKILDVRTPEEYVFVGHAEMGWLIPLVLQTHQWDPAGRHLLTKPNPDFLAAAKEVFKPFDILMVMCRSGGRGAQAVNLLAKHGFTQAFNVVDGMEGDAVDDPDSVFRGKRLKNGWKNSGLPWSYALNPERMRLPTAVANA